MNDPKGNKNNNYIYLEKIIKEIETINKRLDDFEKRIIKIEQSLNEKFSSKKKEENVNYSQKENCEYREGSKLVEYLNFFKLEKLGFEFFEAKDIQKENEKINLKIEEKVYDFLPKNDKNNNETVGEFLYSIGGISRVSQKIANDIFYELFSEYKKYLEDNNTFLSFNLEKDRKLFSIWVRKCIHEKSLFDFIAKSRIKQIEKYLSNPDSKEFLYKIFPKFISLYLKCRLSFPIVNCQYTEENCKFNSSIMLDIIDKGGKTKKVNFCYLPELKSNNKTLDYGKFYVFTYIKDKTYKKESKDGVVFNDTDKIVPIPQIYELPNFNDFKIDRIPPNKLKIISPDISPEFKPKYKLILNNVYKTEFYSEDGIFIATHEFYNTEFKIEIYFYNAMVYKSPQFIYK